MSFRHLYIHIPFCARRCAYCDFAIAVRRVVPVRNYVEALGREIRARFPVREPVEVDTIYLGGGTPSRLGAEGVMALLGMVQEQWRPAPGAEVTLEANPEDVTADAVRAWRRAGVTRVSLGVQSFDDRVLAWMHRVHDARQAAEAARTLVREGVDDWSLDLIFALPPDLGRDWRRDLEQALTLEPSHISCYGLTLEQHTPLARWEDRGLVRWGGDALWEDEFLAAHETLGDAGCEHYEVSNYARDGRYARHNSAYWRRVPYCGLGPAAHGFDGEVRRWNEREFAAWRERALLGEDPIAGEERLTPSEVRAETIYLALRSRSGVLVDEVDRQEIEAWQRAGWAEVDGDRLRLTATGWLRLDALAVALTTARSRL